MTSAVGPRAYYRVAISGAAGRVGRSLVQILAEQRDLQLTVALESSASSFVGHDAGEVAGIGHNGVAISSDLEAQVANFDILIDFTTPAATLANLRICKDKGKRLVVGTTGIDTDGRLQVAAAAVHIPIVMAPNMSVGVNVCFKLIDLAARVLGADTDIEIIEAHHHHKVDAPSGTALRMGEIAAAALGRDLQDVAIFARQGHTGPRPKSAIGFTTIRAGDVIGEHTIWFAGMGERIEITHKASNRINFAQGALRAANWLVTQQPGLYDMQDVLGLKY